MSGPVVEIVDVFAAAPGGGNPAPVVLNAGLLDSNEMLAVAQSCGYESVFVLPAQEPGNDVRLRYFLPTGEVEMCGHATIGALWLLRQAGVVAKGNVHIETLAGVVQSRISDAGDIFISQPFGKTEVLDDNLIVGLIADALNLPLATLMPQPIVNASTSRVKTLIGLTSKDVLDRCQPNFESIEPLCERLGSTGLYPYAIDTVDPNRGAATIATRQFPKASGYPEDPATGIAATALACALRNLCMLPDDVVRFTLLQGYAMGRPSKLVVDLAVSGKGSDAVCWLGGRARPHSPSPSS